MCLICDIMFHHSEAAQTRGVAQLCAMILINTVLIAERLELTGLINLPIKKKKFI